MPTDRAPDGYTCDTCGAGVMAQPGVTPLRCASCGSDRLTAVCLDVELDLGPGGGLTVSMSAEERPRPPRRRS